MKRHLAPILIFLLLGAILNVAVAWGNALLLNVFQVQSNSAHDAYPHWYVDRWQRWGAVRVLSIRRNTAEEPGFDHEPKFHEIISEWSGLDNQFTPPETIMGWEIQRVVDGRGWPMMSFWCEVSRTSEYWRGRKIFNQSGPTGGFATKLPLWNAWWYRTPVLGGRIRVLPYRPIWYGFILNTLFYALTIYLLYWGILGSFTLRRHRRIRRGRCGQCGYLVAPNIGVPGTSPNCPECGTPILSSPDQKLSH